MAPYDGGNARVADDEVDADAQNVTLKSKPVYTPEWFKDVIKAEHKLKKNNSMKIFGCSARCKKTFCITTNAKIQFFLESPKILILY